MNVKANRPQFKVVASAGTYHLPFNRLFEWLRPWTDSHLSTQVIAQHGVSLPMPGADNYTMIAPTVLLQMYRDADVVILQGGAGGVMDARTVRRIPILVPRIPGNSEVVDHHQSQFTRKLANMGIVYSAESRQELWDLLERAYQGKLVTRQRGTNPTPGATNAMQLLKQRPKTLSLRSSVRRLIRSARLSRSK